MENIGLGCALERFEDLPEVRTLIGELPEIYSDSGLVEARLQRFTTILDYYQEQPHLLDKDLESLLAALFGHLDEFRAPEQLVHVTFKYMVMIVKLRGPKSMLRHMPHEVNMAYLNCAVFFFILVVIVGKWINVRTALTS